MKELLNFEILNIGEYSLKLYNLVVLLGFVALVFIILRIIKKVIYRLSNLDTAKKFSINKLTKYIILVLAILTGFHILGFNISVFIAGSAALLVGIGFGLQNLFNDFISGIILLLDSTIKVGDIIEINGMSYRVQEITFRTTTVIGRDENFVILPNSLLTSNNVINWTHSNTSSRFKVTIGVDYNTDINLLMQLLKNVAIANKKILKEPQPFVRFEEFADSSLIFSVFFFTTEIFYVEAIKSELRIEIFSVLKENNITIPFPQRVVHHYRE